MRISVIPDERLLETMVPCTYGGDGHSSKSKWIADKVAHAHALTAVASPGLFHFP